MPMLIDRAKEQASEGHPKGADIGLPPLADVRLPDLSAEGQLIPAILGQSFGANGGQSHLRSEGHTESADKGQANVADAPHSQDDGEGHALAAEQGQRKHALPSSDNAEKIARIVDAESQARGNNPLPIQAMAAALRILRSKDDWMDADDLEDEVAEMLKHELPSEGHKSIADEGHSVSANTGQPELQNEGLIHSAANGQSNGVDVLQTESEKEGQSEHADNGQTLFADLSPLIDAIRFHHRTRIYAMEQRKRADLSLGAFLRMALGWSKSLPDAERKRIAEQAQMLIKIGEAEAKLLDLVTKPSLTKRERTKIAKLEEATNVDEPAYNQWQSVILASIRARAPFDEIEAMATKEMEAYAEQLPVWKTFGESVRGFSARALAVIIGEAGDLSGYPKKGHLWKRMGVAVIGSGDGKDDVRQGGLSKSAKKDDWIEHGYSKKRRSRLYVIGDSLIKTDGLYRSVYLNRLVIEHRKAVLEGLIPATTTAATVESWQKRGLPDLTLVKKLDKTHRGAGHMALRAQRYMEKRLLRDLWQAWRQAINVTP